MAQQPPPQAFSQNFGYTQQKAPMTQNGQQNGQHTNQNLVNGSYQPNVSNPMKPPMTLPSQQIPPSNNLLPQMQQITTQQAPMPTINYQNFQTNALQSGGINGNNSALSSRTSSPGIQQTSIPSNIPPSQLLPSKSFPGYQQMPGVSQQSLTSPVSMPPPLLMNQQKQSIPQQVAPSSQFPNVVSNNNNVGETNITQIPARNFNATPLSMSLPQPPAGQQLSSSMANLTLAPQTFNPTTQMPSSKSDQNLLNNNNMQTKPLQKRPMYPSQQSQQQPFQPISPQQPFNTFPGPQQNIQQSQQEPQRGNLQYQNIQQQQPFPGPGGNVVQQGFNRMWGRETVDLMQNRHILPTTKVLPPPIKLNHQFHESTNCNPDIFRCTLTKIPESNSLLQKSRLPLGILIHPYRDLSVCVFILQLLLLNVINVHYYL